MTDTHRDTRPTRLPMRSEAVEWKLLSSTFHQTFTGLVGTLMFVAVVIVVLVQSGRNTTIVPVILLTFIVQLYRVVLDLAFRRNSRRFDYATWIRLSMAGAVAISILWGTATFFTYGQRDGYLAIILMGAQISYLYGTASRLSACPPIAVVQIATASTIMIAIYLGRHDLSSTIIASLLAINIAPVLLTARRLHAQLALWLTSDEEMEKLALDIEFANSELELANARLANAAVTDDLTSIANRRQLDDSLDIEWRRAERANTPISLYIADIDWFKQYNDTFGHPAGDECLRQVAHALDRSLHRPGDIVGRYGGEEFVAILPKTDAAGALEIAERSRAAVADLKLAHPVREFGAVTISIGVITLAAHPPAVVADLVRLADEALYEAKRLGRNRTCVAAPIDIAPPSTSLEPR